MGKLLNLFALKSAHNESWVMSVKSEGTISSSTKNEEVLGWQCYVVNGSEVFPVTSKRKVIEKTITDYEALKEGMEVSACGCIWTVQKKEGILYLDAPRSFGTLSFGEDFRNCWVCGAVISKRLTQSPKKIPIIS